jgi:ubiquinone/menaquinone biosynthesis C-methylase UbiE
MADAPEVPNPPEAFEYKGYLIPKYLLDMTGAGIDSFDAIAQAHLSQLKQSVDLSPEHHVLEIGSGIGRDAIQLTEYLTTGTYLGVEIIRPSVDWCTGTITEKHPNFKFVYFDVWDQLHNTVGTTHTRLCKIPLEDHSTDRAIMWSVLTHLFEMDVEHYFREFRRVLKPDGLVFATTFIHDDDILASAQMHEMTRYGLRFEQDYGRGCRIDNPQFPAGAVSYSRDAMLKMINESGLYLEGVFHHRNWSGHFPELPVGQDFMVLRPRS